MVARKTAATSNQRKPAAKTPLVGVIMGSKSDWPTMKNAADMLKALGVPFETKIVSAHRTPDRLADYAKSAKDRGLNVIIAGAGGAATWYAPGKRPNAAEHKVAAVVGANRGRGTQGCDEGTERQEPARLQWQ